MIHPVIISKDTDGILKEMEAFGFAQVGNKVDNATSVAAMFRFSTGYFLVVSEHKA